MFLERRKEVRLGDTVWVTVQQRSKGAEGHVWIRSLIKEFQYVNNYFSTM
jgi:hypothetical protein